MNLGTCFIALFEQRQDILDEFRNTFSCMIFAFT